MKKPMATYNRSTKQSNIIRVVKTLTIVVLVGLALPGVLRFIIDFASWLLAVYEVLLG